MAPQRASPMRAFLYAAAHLIKSDRYRGLGDWWPYSRDRGCDSVSLRWRGPRYRPQVEPLEPRACPSSLYNFTVIAQTDGHNVVGLGSGPSINDSGKVAFVEQFADGSNSIFVGGDSPLISEISSGLRDPERTFGNTVEINNGNAIAAVDRDSGAPPQYYMRIWNADTKTYQIIDQTGPEQRSNLSLTR